MSSFTATCGLSPIPFNLGGDAGVIAKNLDEICQRIYIEICIITEHPDITPISDRDQVIERFRSDTRRKIAEAMEYAPSEILLPSTFVESRGGIHRRFEKREAAIKASLDRLQRGEVDWIRYDLGWGSICSLDVSWEPRRIEIEEESRDSLERGKLGTISGTVWNSLPPIDNAYIQWFMGDKIASAS